MRITPHFKIVLCVLAIAAAYFVGGALQVHNPLQKIVVPSMELTQEEIEFINGHSSTETQLQIMRRQLSHFDTLMEKTYVIQSMFMPDPTFSDDAIKLIYAELIGESNEKRSVAQTGVGDPLSSGSIPIQSDNREKAWLAECRGFQVGDEPSIPEGSYQCVDEDTGIRDIGSRI